MRGFFRSRRIEKEGSTHKQGLMALRSSTSGMYHFLWNSFVHMILKASYGYCKKVNYTITFSSNLPHQNVIKFIIIIPCTVNNQVTNPQPKNAQYSSIHIYTITLSIAICFNPHGSIIREQVSNNTAQNFTKNQLMHPFQHFHIHIKTPEYC
jgi:hypothetical protein